jgi:hypothetical protein
LGTKSVVVAEISLARQRGSPKDLTRLASRAAITCLRRIEALHAYRIGNCFTPSLVFLNNNVHELIGGNSKAKLEKRLFLI